MKLTGGLDSTGQHHGDIYTSTRRRMKHELSPRIRMPAIAKSGSGPKREQIPAEEVILRTSGHIHRLDTHYPACDVAGTRGVHT